MTAGHARTIVFGCLFAVAACTGGDAGPADVRPARIAAATDSLRSLYEAGRYDAGARIGARWLDRGVEDPELRARAVEMLAFDGREIRAADEADAFVAELPESPWAWYAKAAALHENRKRREEAFEASAKAVELAPGRLPFARLRAHLLANGGRPRHAVAFVDSLPPELREEPGVLSRKGRALSFLGYVGGDSVDRTRAMETFERVLQKDPDHLRARTWAGYQLAFFENRIPEGLPHLERAARQTTAPAYHEPYWWALDRHPELDSAETAERITEDVAGLLEAHPNSPAVLAAAASAHDDLGMTGRRDEYEERVLERFPDSDEAEDVLVRRYRRLDRELREQGQADGEEDPETRRAFRQAVEAVLDRPVHHGEDAIGGAYRELFELLEGREDAPADSLLMAVRGMLQHQPFSHDFRRAAVALADRGLEPKLAERLPQRGLTETTREAQSLRESYDSEEEYLESLHYRWAVMLDALGRVYHHQGRLDAAGRQLRLALEYEDENAAIHHHLGQLHEARADTLLAADRPAARDRADSLLAEAQSAYVKGILASQREENPNEEALEALYRRRHGSLEGYASFRADLEERSRKQRRERVLAARLDEPEPVRPFTLKDLDGNEVRLSDYEGRIVVVDFWGTWCGPCVVEMDELQEFYERYRDDPEVAVLTIDEGETADHVRSWMEDKGYSYPVLIDEGYISRAGVTAFPTTWFLNREGDKVFERRGNQGDLLETFTWRVEALREESGP